MQTQHSSKVQEAPSAQRHRSRPRAALGSWGSSNLVGRLLGPVSLGGGYRIQREISFLESFLNEFSHQKWFSSLCRIKGDLEDVGVH